MTVRNMSTKDKPGTLPLNAYVKKSTPSTPFTFGSIGSNEDTPDDIAEQIVYFKAKTLLIMKEKDVNGKVVLVHVLQDVFDHEKMVKVQFLVQDVNNPCLFKLENLGEIAISMVEIVCLDDASSLDSDELKISECDFEKLWRSVSDSGDLVTTSEELEIESDCSLENKIAQEVQPYRTRSGRLTKYNKSSDYLYV
jgi:hypothetical protein